MEIKVDARTESQNLMNFSKGPSAQNKYGNRTFPSGTEIAIENTSTIALGAVIGIELAFEANNTASTASGPIQRAISKSRLQSLY